MRYALFSDVHANLPALEAVLQDVSARPGIDAVYHLGDLVGYGPWPNETVALLRERRIAGIQGNHDARIAAAARTGPRGPEAGSGPADWTLTHTTDETRRFLASLPFRMDVRPAGGHTPGPSVMLVHGTPARCTDYWYEDRSDASCLDLAAAAGARAGDVICFGHTHLPWYREVQGVHLVNTGSVGRPKDGDWRAGYVVLDLRGDGPEVEFVRVEYDVDRAMEAIRRSGLPAESVDYLRTGGRPDAAADK